MAPDEDYSKCWETGRSLVDAYHGSRFINTKARQDWNNRRKTRGAAVYDLLMGWRYDRPIATTLHVFVVICQLLKQWHDEDKAAGRIGYLPPAAALKALGKEAD
jgi:hypothetical protein